MSHAPRYRLNTGVCSDVFTIGTSQITYDSCGNPVLINPNDKMPYMKCPSLANPTAGMATSTNDTNISKKMRFAQQIRVGSALKGGKSYFSVNKTNTFGSWQGAPGGSREAIRNAF
jgi:hypothetical protein